MYNEQGQYLVKVENIMSEAFEVKIGLKQGDVSNVVQLSVGKSNKKIALGTNLLVYL